MEFRKMVRWQVVLAGLGAALLFTPVVKSQEITNTAFDDGPNVARFSEPAPAPISAAAVPQHSAVPSGTESGAVETSFSMERASLLDSPVVTAGLTLLLLACIALSAVSESRRSRRNYSDRTYSSGARA
jgi:hypothetical protein